MYQPILGRERLCLATRGETFGMIELLQQTLKYYYFCLPFDLFQEVVSLFTSIIVSLTVFAFRSCKRKNRVDAEDIQDQIVNNELIIPV